MINNDMKKMFKNNYERHNINEMDDIEKEKIRECLFKLYISILTRRNDPLYEMRFNEFKRKYDCLNEEEKKYIQDEFTNIISTQEEKSKVKRKGMINYE